MKSWLCYLSPYACGLSVPCRGHSEINNVWSGCLGTNQIIDNWHRCLGVMWRKRKLFWSIIKKTFLWTVNFISLTHKMIYILWGPFLIVWKWNFEWNQNITRKFVATNDTVICFFPTSIGAHSQTEVSSWSWSNRLRGEWYNFNY